MKKFESLNNGKFTETLSLIEMSNMKGGIGKKKTYHACYYTTTGISPKSNDDMCGHTIDEGGGSLTMDNSSIQ